MSAERRARALSPNTPPDELLELLEFYPREVLQNPALPLLVLEDPTLGPLLQERIRRAWLTVWRRRVERLRRWMFLELGVLAAILHLLFHLQPLWLFYLLHVHIVSIWLLKQAEEDFQSECLEQGKRKFFFILVTEVLWLALALVDLFWKTPGLLLCCLIVYMAALLTLLSLPRPRTTNRVR